MREAGGIEVQSNAERFGPVDPSGEVLRADRVTIDASRPELAVEGVQVEAMFSRDQRQRPRRVAAQLVGRARLAGIVARRGEAATELAVRLLESADVVSLPAVERDGHEGEAADGGVGVDAEVGIALPGDQVGAR